MTAEKAFRSPNRSAMVQVKIQGTFDQDWMQNFQGITTDFDGEITTLNGYIADQSALRGLLCTLWDFNLAILSVILDYGEGNPAETGCLEERK